MNNACVVIPNLSNSKVSQIIDFFHFNDTYTIVVDKGDNYQECLFEGLKAGLEYQFDFIAVVSPKDFDKAGSIFAMLQLVADNDLVIGSRFLPFSLGQTSLPYPKKSYYKDKFLSTLLNFTQLDNHYSDWLSDFRVYRSDLVTSLLEHQYYSKTEAINIELLAKAIQLGANIGEYPLSYSPSQYSTKEAVKVWFDLAKTYHPRPTVIESELL